MIPFKHKLAVIFLISLSPQLAAASYTAEEEADLFRRARELLLEWEASKEPPITPQTRAIEAFINNALDTDKHEIYQLAVREIMRMQTDETIRQDALNDYFSFLGHLHKDEMIPFTDRFYMVSANAGHMEGYEEPILQMAEFLDYMPVSKKEDAAQILLALIDTMGYYPTCSLIPPCFNKPDFSQHKAYETFVLTCGLMEKTKAPLKDSKYTSWRHFPRAMKYISMIACDDSFPSVESKIHTVNKLDDIAKKDPLAVNTFFAILEKDENKRLLVDQMWDHLMGH